MIGDAIARRLPANAVILAMQHSGSVRYYAGREIVRYDLMPPHRLDRLMKRLRRLGRHRLPPARRLGGAGVRAAVPGAQRARDARLAAGPSSSTTCTSASGTSPTAIAADSSARARPRSCRGRTRGKLRRRRCSSASSSFPTSAPRPSRPTATSPSASTWSRCATSSASPTSAPSSTTSTSTAATAPTRSCSSPPPPQRTRRARLVTGAVLPVFNHPLKLAGEIGMLDAISGGRLEVGFARAFLPHEFARFGRSVDESRARFDEGIEQVRRLLEEENVYDRGPLPQLRRTSPRCRGRRSSRARRSGWRRSARRSRSSRPGEPGTA